MNELPDWLGPRERVLIAEDRWSTDLQTMEGLAFIRENYPTDFAKVRAEFPETDSLVWSGSWVDTETMGLDPEWSSWLADAVESTGRVEWSDGDLWGWLVIGEDRYPTRDDYRDSFPRRWDDYLPTIGEWLVIADASPIDVDPSIIADCRTTSDVADYLADRWWSSTMADYVSTSPELAICNAASLLENFNINPADIVTLRPWDHEGSVWFIHPTMLDDFDELREWFVGLAESYPVADDELLSMTESAYVMLVADNNRPTDLAPEWEPLWRAAWQASADYRGAREAWVEPSDGPNEWRDACDRVGIDWRWCEPEGSPYRADADVLVYPSHDWQTARFTGAITCSRCGLLPLDEDDRATVCYPSDGPR